jgi:diguanylate cyclase (GGDEF)-like protein
MSDSAFNIQGLGRKGLQKLALWLKFPIIISLIATGTVVALRQMALLQPLELMALDQLMRLRPASLQDSRLLIVAITEEDIRAKKHWPISDEEVAKLLSKLQEYKPRGIGLDIYRDMPQPPGYAELQKQLQAPNVITIQLLADPTGNGTPPPPGVPAERVGFSDIVIDSDAVVRRNFMFARTDSNEELYSFSLRLALLYLQPYGLKFVPGTAKVEIGNTTFPALKPSSGSYLNLDDRGCQILLNYRNSGDVARQVTLSQVLEGKVDPAWVRDKLVLIGTTAPSAKDLFLTPYNLADTDSPKTPGVVVQAQMASQILTTVLDRESLLWDWSDPVEVLWIWVWGLAASILVWQFRHPLLLGLIAVAAITGLTLICFALLLKAGWVPLVPAAIAFLLAGAAMIAYRRLYDYFHDALTELPNRALFMQYLRWAIKGRRFGFKTLPPADTPTMAVLLLGLDGFKAINDSFGHRMGDQMLIATTERLTSCLSKGDRLGRIAGDEFAILRPCLEDTDEVTYLADRLQRQVTQPYKLNGQELFTTASVGIVMGRAGADYDPEDILRDVHTAMQRAKATGKARHEVFVTGMRDQVMTRLQLETDLRRAIERQEFRLHYQPIVILQTGKLAGVEALVRWQHPQRGLVPPAEFIPIAEETDLILPLSRWIIQEACHQIKSWQEKFPRTPHLLVSVNFSGKQFSQPDLVKQIRETLEETGLDGRSLKLEITESTAMTDVETTITHLQQLKSLNLQLSIDDFGTGYSSLSYLHRFPTNTIKVDRSFVSRMGEGSEDAQIVQTIIILGHNLGMDIVAEGVETAEQLALLRSLGCEYGQGYFFSKPLPAEATETLLEKDPIW